MNDQPAGRHDPAQTGVVRLEGKPGNDLAIKAKSPPRAVGESIGTRRS